MPCVLPTNGANKRLTLLACKKPEEPPAFSKLVRTNALHPELCNANVRIILAVNFGYTKDLPFDAQGTLKLCDFRTTITHADPRRLLVNLAHDDCQMSFAVLHVPCKTSQCSIDEIQNWWKDTLRLIRDASMAPLTWAFVDANAPLTSCTTDRIGLAGAEPYESHWHIV